MSEPRSAKNNRWPLGVACTCLLAIYVLTPPGPLPLPDVRIFQRGPYRYVVSNGIPDHPTGDFPNDRNPNRIRPQSHMFRVPLHPTRNERLIQVGLHPFGVACNGIPFDPLANEYYRNRRRSGWRYEALSPLVDLGLDKGNAHVQPNGNYHYHGQPTIWLAAMKATQQPLRLLGYAADGFPIYNDLGPCDPFDLKSPTCRLRSSYKLREGLRPNPPGGRYDGRFCQDYLFVPNAGDLDQCNGRFGATTEYPDGIYYYVITRDFPGIPRYFRGTPDPSFLRGSPQPTPSYR